MEINKLLILVFILLALPLGSCAICQTINPITNIPCDIVTPVVYCSSNAYVNNLNTSTNYSLPMISLGDGTYKIIFNYGIGEYSVILCDNSSTTFSVISASGTTPTYYPTTPLAPTSRTSKINSNNYNISVQVSQYPYADINQTTNYYVEIIKNSSIIGNLTNTLIIRELNGSNSSINLPFDAGIGLYHIGILFDSAGNYPFDIFTNGTGINTTIASGTMIVRKPFYVYVKIYHENNLQEYRNNYGYVTAEFSTQRSIDAGLEPFFYTIKSSSLKSPVFHANYIDGTARLKLFENNTKYIYRFQDGVTFNSSYSVPQNQQISKTSMYLGSLVTTNSTTYQFVLNERELHPFNWLMNVIFFIILGASIIIGIFLFFVIPEKPTFALIFILIIAGGAILVRLVIFIWQIL